MKVAVIGGGAAGTAAAWAARRAGADVVLFHDRPGATALCSGALDQGPVEDPGQPILAPEVLAFGAALDAWTVGTAAARIATHEGVLRTARGTDDALLDLTPLAGRRVAVAASPIDGFSGGVLARSLRESAWAARTRTRFEAVTVDGIVDPGESRATAFDVAAMHDSPERIARLAECLRRADASADAWLVGPWLGTTVGPAASLRRTIGHAVGETTSPPGGPAGARFEASRDSLLASLGVSVRTERIAVVERRGRSWDVRVGRSSSPPGGADAEVDAVVVAIGGVAAGGIALAEWGSEGALRASLEAPLRLGLDGHPLEASARSGPDWVALGLRALLRVGILADGVEARGSGGLLVAGDAAADRPRTVLEAVQSGIEAGARAAR